MKRLKQHLTKTACVFFSFVLVFSMVPSVPAGAFAAEGDGAGGDAPSTPLAIGSSGLLAGEGEGDEPTTSAQVESVDLKADSWADLQAEIDAVASGQTIELTADINAGAGDNKLWAHRDGVDFTIDLKGHTIDRKLADSAPDEDNNGHVFDVEKGTLTLKDGTITGGNDDTRGGGIVIGGKGHVNTYNVTIAGNTGGDGGGIFVYGQLVMTGGSITGNTGNDGGGIYVHKSGEVSLTNVAITNNSTPRGGGGINNKGRATLAGCTITANKATHEGGGFYDEGDATLTSCTISENESTGSDGGAVCAHGAVTLVDCIMKSNTCADAGGAIRVASKGQVSLSGGTIGGDDHDKNIAKNRGGGIYLDNGGTLNLNSATDTTENTLTISYNVAYKGGSGVWVGSNDNKINLGSGVVVEKNVASDFWLYSGKKINVTEPLADGTNVSVALDSLGGTFTTNFKATNGSKDPSRFFTAESGYSVVADGDGEAKVLTSNWVELQKLIDEADNGGVIKLEQSWKAVDENVALVIPKDKVITIDLYGHTIDRHRSSYTADGEVFIVNGTLNIVDNSYDKNGTITGGYGDVGGIRVNSDAMLKLQSGTISGNKSKTGGGGVRVFAGGTLETYGGSISNNTSEAHGGGVYNEGTVQLAGSTISNNSASDGIGGGIYNEGTTTLESGSITANAARWGGGVRLSDGDAGAFTMNGGTISSNTATENGGGLCVDRGTVTINGGEITDNSADGNGGGVDLGGGTFNLYGGTIAENHAAYDGGGIYNHTSGAKSLNVKGAPTVSRNTATIGRNIMLMNDARITLVDALDYSEVEGAKNARLDVVTHDSNQAITSGFTAKAADIRCFTTNDANPDKLEVHDDGELYMKQAAADVWVSSWGELMQRLKDVPNGTTIALRNDIYGEYGTIQRVEGKTVTLELNGHVIDCNDGAGGFYIRDNDGDKSEFTIRDSVGTGAIVRAHTSGDGSAIWIYNNCTVNMYNVVVSDCNAMHGAAIYVDNGRLNMYGGAIVRNSSYNGGGIYCKDDGQLNLQGVNISDNYSTHQGAGIYTLSHDDVELTSCVIRNNRAHESNGAGIYMDLKSSKHLRITNTHIIGNTSDGKNGGGIYVNDGILDMTGGSISRNSAQSGGGIYINDCAVNLTGVMMAENKANDGIGGAICNDDGSSNLYRCILSGNQAIKDDNSGQGGGILGNDESTVYAENCAFLNNKADGNGGALAVYGEATVHGGTFTGNESKEYGGAIHIGHGDDSKFTLDGSPAEDGTNAPVSITNNKALLGGSGIRVSHKADSFKMKGSVSIYNNFNNADLYLEDDARINITGALTGSQIRVLLEKDTGTFTSGFSGNNAGHAPSEFFAAQEGYSVIPTDDGAEAQVVASEWSTLQRFIDATESGQTLKLERDWKAAPQDVALQIAADKEITIDLNGHTIDRARTQHSAGGEVFNVNGSLTIIDTSEATETTAAGSGKVVGGYGDGGGFVVNDGATLTLSGGNVAGNKASNGGGVLVNAGGTFAMSGGTITGNHADGDGGGVYSNGTVNLTGGTIKNNEANNNAGGLWFAAGSTLNVSGAPYVKGNLAPAGKNILICSGGVVTVADELGDSAVLDIVTQNPSAALTSGLTTSGNAGRALSVFSYNEEADRLKVENDELYLIQANAEVTGISTWQSLQEAMRDTPTGQTIRLDADITAGSGEITLGFERPDTAITIDLNGHVINRNLKEADDDNKGHVFDVNKGTLTIKDSAGVGRITGGYTEDYKGGGIVIGGEGHLIVEGGSIVDNRSVDEGGGIHVYGELKMTGGYIARNTSKSGGGIFVHESGTADIKNVVFMSNNANKSGGGALNNKGTATLKNCIIRENSAGNEGGGIYQGSKSLTLTNCEIRNNSAPGGGGMCCFGTVTVENTVFSGNQASDQGGGVNVHGTFTMTGGEISGNNGNDGGGMYNYGGTVTLSNVVIAANYTPQGGGALNNKGQAKLTACNIANNTAVKEGGGMYANSAGYTELEGCTIEGNQSTENDGGAFDTYGSARISNCTIKSNTAKKSGGALRIHQCTVDIAGGTVIQNRAKEYGGAVYINNGGTLNLDGATITQNTADINGGGVWVGEGTNSVTIKGAVNVSENDGGSDVYLPSGKVLAVTGSLGEETGPHANIGVSTAGAVGVVFTSGYSNDNASTDPAVYFHSSDDYQVYLEGAEASTKNAEAETDPFIDPGSQVNPDYGELNGKNWMSGISGERYLNEINMPGTHDSSTKVVEGNVSTGQISTWAGIGGAAIGFVFGTITMTGPLTWGIFGGLDLPNYISDWAKKFANTQTRYIDEQLEDGIRSLDIRLNTYYSNQGYPVNKHDNGEDLYQLHGKTKQGGSYFAKDRNDDFLTFKTTCGYLRDFLEKHPSETIILTVAYESVDDDYDDYVARLAKHLRNELALEVNPSTNKPYLYMEDGVFGKKYTHYPQLKECRGQVILQCDSGDAEVVGGLVKGVGLDRVESPEGSYTDTADEKIAHLRQFLADHGYDSLPSTLTDSINYLISVGTNATETGALGIPSRTPLEIADDVLPVLFKDPTGLLLNRVGKYIGLINMDAETAAYSKLVWITNFFDELEYCTVTVKAGDDDKSPETYTVSYGTRIDVPKCSFTSPYPGKPYFRNWLGTEDKSLSGNTWELEPGGVWTITGDTTFTAQWGETQKTPVEVLWRDGKDAAGIRPDTLKLTAKVGDKDQTITVKAEKNWQGSFTGEVTANGITPDMSFDADNLYTCTVSPRTNAKGEIVPGVYVVLTYTPSTTVEVKGTVNWVDNENAGQTRPASVTLHLMQDSNVMDSAVVKPDADGSWSFDFGERPEYVNGEKVPYSISEEGDGITSGSKITYNYYTKGYDITNVLIGETTTELTGWVCWVDNDNEAGKRPDSVTVHLFKGDEEVASQVVSGNRLNDREWPIDFVVDGAVDGKEYRIAQDAVEDYETKPYSTESMFGFLVVGNTYTGKEHEHTENTVMMPLIAATCTEGGSRFEITYCSECGKEISKETVSTDPLGHDWGEWKTLKEATETQPGFKMRTCNRNVLHMQFDYVPNANAEKQHVHGLTHTVAKAATCTTDGNIEYWQCTKDEGDSTHCDLFFTDAGAANVVSEEGLVVHALGHDWGEWTVTKEATETEDGLKTRSCTRCDATESIVIPHTGHMHGLTHTDGKAATCTTDGNIEYWRCTQGDDPCRLYFGDAEATEWLHDEGVVVHATGHDWSEWETVKEATEKAMGMEMRRCSNNVLHFQYRAVPQAGHVHVLTRIPAKESTCTKTGNIEYWKCTGGDYPCELCYQDDSGSESAWIAEEDTVLPALGHDWGEWTVTKPATETEEGAETRTCGRCGETETRAIPVGIAYHYVGPADPDWTKGSADVLTLTFKRSSADEQTFGLFAGIEVDGVAVPETDSTGKVNYAAESGSLILKLQPSYLETLSVGDHQVKALFKDGSASTAVAVKAVATKPANSELAKTGDAVPVVFIAITILLAAAMLVIARRKSRA